ncbi:MAG: PEP-CTERM sorting domain-containing protein [Isosphaeraceae bacterium]|nr:PEP-CTERM sorting domain-containing protein [Isosphaeraceae bacterium]
MRTWTGLAFAIGMMVRLGGSEARAELLAYDGFDYASVGSPLLGGNGGSGFADSWHAGGFNAVNHDNYLIGSSSLTFSNLLTSGNHVSSGALTAIGGIVRDLSTPLAAGMTEYISVLLRPEGVPDQGALNGYFGLYLNASTGNDLFLGKPGGGSLHNYVIEDRGGARQHASGVSAVVGEAALLVVRADLMPGNDRFTLYVNPTPGAPEPSSGTVKFDSDVGTATGLTIYSTGAFSIDEIRVGTTFADVVPVVPEPSSLVLAGLGLLGLLGVARCRCQQAA